MSKLAALLLILAFAASTSAVDVKCNFKKAFFGGANILTCFTEQVRESIGCDEPDEIQIVNECDLPANTTLDDVEGIYSKDTPWPRFPINLYKKFPRLRAIEMDGCGLDNLRSTYFINLNFLWHISMPRNNFRSLQGRLFRFTRNLRWVNFRGNPNLINIGFNIFGSLPYLKEINFGDIGCGDGGDMATSDSSMFSRFASRLMRACPPDEEDLADDLDKMECTFDTEKESGSKTGSNENTTGSATTGAGGATTGAGGATTGAGGATTGAGGATTTPAAATTTIPRF